MNTAELLRDLCLRAEGKVEFSPELQSWWARFREDVRDRYCFPLFSRFSLRDALQKTLGMVDEGCSMNHEGDEVLICRESSRPSFLPIYCLCSTLTSPKTSPPEVTQRARELSAVSCEEKAWVRIRAVLSACLEYFPVGQESMESLDPESLVLDFSGTHEDQGNTLVVPPRCREGLTGTYAVKRHNLGFKVEVSGPEERDEVFKEMIRVDCVTFFGPASIVEPNNV